MTLQQLILCLERRAEQYHTQQAWAADPRYTPDLLALAAVALRRINHIDDEVEEVVLFTESSIKHRIENAIERALKADPANICNLVGADAKPPDTGSRVVEMMLHPSRAHDEERKHIISHKRSALCERYGCVPYGGSG